MWEHPHPHTNHLVLKNTSACMKAAIHIANLGALKSLHRMFSQKLWVMQLWPNVKK